MFSLFACLFLCITFKFKFKVIALIYNIKLMSDTPGVQGAELKFVSVARVADSNVLLALPSSTTKKAYADEVSSQTANSPI